MAAKATQNNLLAGRYASALIDLADDSQVIDKVEKDVVALRGMIASSADLKSFIATPLANTRQQTEAVTALAQKAGFNDMTIKFLSVIVANRRLAALPVILKSVQDKLVARRGGVEARVQTAVALTAEQTRALQEALSKSTGKSVNIHAEVKEDILGGMIVTVGSQMIDTSVKRKLERLKRAMNSNEQSQKEVG